jgi:hypothetical protein
MSRVLPWLALLLVVAAPCFAQYDLGEFKVAKPEDRVDAPSTPPPPGALVLFDGKNLQENWVMRKDGKAPAAWKLLEGGIAQVNGTGDVISKQTFDGKFYLHVEFRVPYMPKDKGQGRGNSGVYVQGRYEVQILDSYGLESKNNDCGAIYEVAAPKINACKAPTVWQSYDIHFQSPKFENGKKVRPAAMTVYQNGVKIHDNVQIPVDHTRAGMETDPSTPGPILLQDHGNPVQFRSVWLVPEK